MLVLLVAWGSALHRAWVAAASHCLSPSEPVTLGLALCVLGRLPGARSAQDCATSPFSWNSRSKNKTNALFTPQLFPASFFRFAPMALFSQEL